MMFLTPAELKELTGKLQRHAQRKVLNYMGIEHRLRPDGSLLVSRSHVEKILDGIQGAHSIGQKTEPNWDVL